MFKGEKGKMKKKSRNNSDPEGLGVLNLPVNGFF